MEERGPNSDSSGGYSVRSGERGPDNDHCGGCSVCSGERSSVTPVGVQCPLWGAWARQ